MLFLTKANYKAFKAMNHRKLVVFSGVLFLSKSSRINPAAASSECIFSLIMNTNKVENMVEGVFSRAPANKKGSRSKMSHTNRNINQQSRCDCWLCVVRCVRALWPLVWLRARVYSSVFLLIIANDDISNQIWALNFRLITRTLLAANQQKIFVQRENENNLMLRIRAGSA
jgi:hypothetical protein